MDLSLFAILGRLVVAYGVYKCARAMFPFLSWYILPRVGIRVDAKKYGSWAVVTGATDGIGKSYAKELAKAGLNLILISRTAEKLENTKQDILSIAKVEIKTVTFDFTNTDGYEIIAEALKDLDIGILVNNVGVCYAYPEYVNECDVKLFENIVTVNCMATIKMTLLVLNGMLHRKRGAIVTVSSLSSHRPFQFLNVYSASKVFVEYFTMALGQEYPSSGIDFQVLCPGLVATKMSGMRPSLTVPSSDTYARSAFGTLGMTPLCHGHWTHEVRRSISCLLPTSLWQNLITKRMLMARERALRKLQLKKK